MTELRRYYTDFEPNQPFKAYNLTDADVHRLLSLLYQEMQRYNLVPDDELTFENYPAYFKLSKLFIYLSEHLEKDGYVEIEYPF